MALMTLDAVKAQLNIDATDTSYDVELQTFMGAAAGAVERALGRVVVPRSVSDRFNVSGAVAEVLLRHVPVLSVTSVVSADGSMTWSTANLRVDSETGLVTVAAGAAFTGVLDFLYQAGLSVIPDDYRLAGLIIVQHLWETQRGTMGIQLGGDNEPYMPGRGFAIPRRALELLDTQLPGVA